MAPLAAGLGTATTAAIEGGAATAAECGASASPGAGGGASASAVVNCRTLSRNRSPPLVLTMFGGGADREWEDCNETKGVERAG